MFAIDEFVPTRQDVLPVRLGFYGENSYGPVSLKDLLVRYAKFFFVNGDMLRQAVGSLAGIADEINRNGGVTTQTAEYLVERHKHAQAVVKCLESLCGPLPLPVSKKAIERVKALAEQPLAADPVSISSLMYDLDNLSKTIGDELDSLEFLPVSPDRRKYLFADSNLFGERVAEAFPSSTVDIVEAGRCYALHRNTACVFHCMRVLEFGIQAVARATGIVDLRPNWEPVIARLDKLLRMDSDFLKRNPTDTVSEVHSNREYYAGVSAYFNAVKIAWRNRVMHVGVEYSGEHANLILGAVRGFMQHLATRLSEDPAMGS